jgi:hypothetical protein
MNVPHGVDMKTLMTAFLACLDSGATVHRCRLMAFILLPKAPQAEVQTQDGRTHFLGARKIMETSVKWFRSKTNDNARFSLNLAIPPDPALLPTEIVLVVAGTAHRT